MYDELHYEKNHRTNTSELSVKFIAQTNIKNTYTDTVSYVQFNASLETDLALLTVSIIHALRTIQTITYLKLTDV